MSQFMVYLIRCVKCEQDKKTADFYRERTLVVRNRIKNVRFSPYCDTFHVHNIKCEVKFLLNKNFIKLAFYFKATGFSLRFCDLLIRKSLQASFLLRISSTIHCGRALQIKSQIIICPSMQIVT